MKFCPNCRISYDDQTNVCGQCGQPLVTVAPQPTAAAGDHTAEFSPADISDNKVLAMVPYLFGWAGIIIALLAAGHSPYAAFHVKQALKIQIVAAIVSIIGAIIPVLGWIAIGIYSIVTLVISIICFVGVCGGKAKEPPLVGNLSFLK